MPDYVSRQVTDAVTQTNVKIVAELMEGMPVAMDEGLRFAIREGGRTVGSGVVTKIIQ